MRKLLLLLTLTSVWGCGTLVCNDQTLLIDATMQTSSQPDTLDITVSYDDQILHASLPYQSQFSEGTIQVEFPKGYPAGKVVNIVVIALLGGQTIGIGTTATTFSASCTKVEITISAISADAGVPDMTPPADMTPPPDMTPILSLLAGKLGGPGNVDGTGAAARLNFPNGMVSDGTGNIFIADAGNHIIRKLVTSTGVVTTLAGTAGISGSTDGIGTAAKFNALRGITIFGANLFVADTSNNTIRKIVIATGEVTTLAGMALQPGGTDGIGALARFNSPSGITSDGTGNLFVADTGNHTIRQLVISSAVVSTLAGTAGSPGSTDATGAAARFYSPRSIISDGVSINLGGKLFITDTNNHTIRQIIISSAAVSTLAGTAGASGSTDGAGAAARFNHPIGITIDGAAGNLFVTDTDNHTVRKMVINSAVVSTLAGTALSPGSTDGSGAVARFNSPSGIANAGSGNLFVADTNNHTIRRIVINSTAVTTVAGMVPSPGSADGVGAAASFKTPFGVTSDDAGNLFVADTANHTIRKIVIATGEVSTLAGVAGQQGSTDSADGGTAKFNNPTGIVSDEVGNLFVADAQNNTIRRIVINTGEVTTFAGAAGQQGGADGIGPAARFKGPFGIISEGPNLFVTDAQNNTIRQIVIDSAAVTTLAGTAGAPGSNDGIGAAARFKTPYGIVSDGAGNLFIADTFNHTIRQMVINNRVVTTLAGTALSPGSTDGTGAAARFNTPVGIIIDDAGNLIIADTFNHAIRQIVISSAAVTTVVGRAGQSGVKLGALPGGLNMPTGLAMISGGGLIIVSYGENSILLLQ